MKKKIYPFIMFLSWVFTIILFCVLWNNYYKSTPITKDTSVHKVSFEHSKMYPKFMEIVSLKKQMREAPSKELQARLNLKKEEYNKIANQFQPNDTWKFALPNNIE